MTLRRSAQHLADGEVFMTDLLWLGDKSRTVFRSGEAEARALRNSSATLTLHFCDEVFACGPRNRATRVSIPGQMFGLRMWRTCRTQTPTIQNSKPPNR